MGVMADERRNPQKHGSVSDEDSYAAHGFVRQADPVL